VEKETLVVNPNDLGSNPFLRPSHFFSGIGYRTIHLYIVLMRLISSISPYAFSIFSKGDRFEWISLGY
jgi:hypothetical protein